MEHPFPDGFDGKIRSSVSYCPGEECKNSTSKLVVTHEPTIYLTMTILGMHYMPMEVTMGDVFRGPETLAPHCLYLLSLYEASDLYFGDLIRYINAVRHYLNVFFL